MKKILLIILLFVGITGVQAQLVDVTIEPYVVHDGMVGTADLTGFTTYRVYANCTNETDFVSAITGLNTCQLEINTTTSFFQTPFGGLTGDAINPALIATFPELEFDSWVTIGRQDMNDPGGAINTLSGEFDWSGQFEAGGNITITDAIGGGWFALNGDVNASAGPELSVLIGQFTTDGDIIASIGIQIFPENNGDNSVEYCNQEFTSLDCNLGCTDPEAINYDEDADCDSGNCIYPCGIEIAGEVLTIPNCVGGSEGSITVSASGNQGQILYSFEGGDFFVIDTWTDLSAGIYEVVVQDDLAGLDECYDTLMIEVMDPEAIEVVLTLDEGITCNGDDDAVISGVGTGGTGELVFDTDPEFSNPVSDILLEDLGPGLYTVYAQDELGCTGESNAVSVVQPFNLQVSITDTADATCENTDDAEIVGIAIGGTGTLTYSIDGENFGSLNFFEVEPGSYAMTVMDANGCTAVSDSATVGAPDAIIVSATSMMPTCFGDSDGSIDASAEGGNGGFLYEIDGETSTGMFGDLAAGDYTIIATDAEGCIDSTMFTLGEPEMVTFTLSVNDISCNGEVDGEITVVAEGGNGGFSYSIDGGEFGTNPVFGDLAVNTYTIDVVDINGCTAEQASEDIEEPTALDVTVDSVTGESGDGENDGAIDITVTGGTGDYDFDWTNTDGFSSSDEDLSGIAGGDYTLVVTDENDCTFTIDIVEVATSITEFDFDVNVTLFPNPSNGVSTMTIEGLSGQAVTYSVVDVQGRTIENRQLNVSNLSHVEEINLNDASTGMYYLQLTIGNQTKTIKMVVQK